MAVTVRMPDPLIRWLDAKADQLTEDDRSGACWDRSAVFRRCLRELLRLEQALDRHDYLWAAPWHLVEARDALDPDGCSGEAVGFLRVRLDPEEIHDAERFGQRRRGATRSGVFRAAVMVARSLEVDRALARVSQNPPRPPIPG